VVLVDDDVVVVVDGAVVAVVGGAVVVVIPAAPAAGNLVNRSPRSVAAAALRSSGVTPRISWTVRNVEACEYGIVFEYPGLASGENHDATDRVIDAVRLRLVPYDEQHAVPLVGRRRENPGNLAGEPGVGLRDEAAPGDGVLLALIEVVRDDEVARCPPVDGLAQSIDYGPTTLRMAISPSRRSHRDVPSIRSAWTGGRRPERTLDRRSRSRRAPDTASAPPEVA
jgi:hypothetical protein